MNAATALTLVDIVVRDTSNPNEADTAKRQLVRMIDRAGSITNLFGAGVATAPSPPMSFSESRRKIAEMEATIEKLTAEARVADKRASKLVHENTKLKTELEAAKAAMRTSPLTKAAVSDGTLPYIDFSSRAKAFLGNSWASQFASLIEGGATTIARMRAAKAVPEEWLTILTGMKPPLPAGVFSPEEVRQIRGWARKGDDNYIAMQASSHFGYVVTPHRILRLRSNLRNGHHNYAEKEYGGALPLFNRERQPPFPWRDHPKVELEAAKLFLEGAGPAKIAKFVARETGLEINDNQVNQRMYNSRPPEGLISDVATSGPLTIAEIWLIFKTLYSDSKSWQLNAREILDLPQKIRNSDLRSIPAKTAIELRERYKKHLALGK